MYLKRTKAHLGDFFKKARLEAGVPQSTASKALGYTSPQFISNMERKLCEPSLDMAIKLAKMYGVSKKDLVKALVKVYRTNLEDQINV